MPWTLNMCHSSNFDAFFPVKINKMWNFCLKLWFFRNHLSQRLKTCGIGFSMPQTLNKCHWSHFNALIPVKINKMWNFDCFLNSPNQTLKNVNLHREKVFAKACKSAHIGFWVCWSQCTVLKLCVTSTFQLLWFLYIFMGRSKYRVLKHGVGVKWDTRRNAACVPFHFHGFEPHFLLCVS